MKIIDFVFYYVMKVFLKILLSLFYKVKINNPENIPKHGAALLAGNHTSWLDTLILSISTNRRIWFVTGDFILDVPIMKNIVQHLYILPMRRNAGKSGIKLAVNKLNEQKLVCIFPEGGLTPTGEIQRFRNGVSIIQKEANVPVVPFYLDGAIDAWSEFQPKFKMFCKMSVTFGEPFYPQQTKETDIANEIKEKVIALKANL